MSNEVVKDLLNYAFEEVFEDMTSESETFVNNLEAYGTLLQTREALEEKTRRANYSTSKLWQAIKKEDLTKISEEAHHIQTAALFAMTEAAKLAAIAKKIKLSIEAQED